MDETIRKMDPRLGEDQTLVTGSPIELAAVYDYDDEGFYSDSVKVIDAKMNSEDSLKSRWKI